MGRILVPNVALFVIEKLSSAVTGSDAVDGAHCATSKCQRVVTRTVDLGKGKAIACGNRQFYELRFGHPGFYLSPICAIFVSECVV
jgi:hypothetical protein